MRTFNYAAILMVLSIFWVPWVNANDLSADYLYGRWAIDKQNCSSADSEYMEFNKNGTFEGTRTGQAIGPAKASGIGQAGRRRIHHAGGV